MKRPLCLLLLFPALAIAGSGIEAARKYRRQNGPEIIREYAKFLSIPNVAADHENIRRNANYILDAFRKRGATMELLELPNASPVVFGELKAPGATRTLLLYFHYDGQPADPTRWAQDPWKATLYTASMEDGGKARALPLDGEEIDPESRLYARSAGDDKVAYPCLLAALDGLAEAGIPLTSNLKFFFEGEEEMGSPHLREFLITYKDRLDGDIWLFLDGPMHQSRHPLLTFGVRGVTGMEITVFGARRSLHSGHYGNWAPDPGLLMAHLLASIKSPDGEVLVDGFYDSVTPLGKGELDALASIPDYDDEMRKELGIAQTELANTAYKERLLLPSLTIKGVSSGNVGDLARNVIPSHATATLGMRLVKGNDPDHMLGLLEKHIRKQGFHIVSEDPDQATREKYPRIAKVVRDRFGYPAARTEIGNPVVGQVIAAARKASDQELYLMPGVGGSLPLHNFTDMLGKPAVIVPVANHDDNQHAPNENIRVANLWYGIDLYASLFTMEK